MSSGQSSGPMRQCGGCRRVCIPVGTCSTVTAAFAHTSTREQRGGRFNRLSGWTFCSAGVSSLTDSQVDLARVGVGAESHAGVEDLRGSQAWCRRVAEAGTVSNVQLRPQRSGWPLQLSSLCPLLPLQPRGVLTSSGGADRGEVVR